MARHSALSPLFGEIFPEAENALTVHQEPAIYQYAVWHDSINEAKAWLADQTSMTAPGPNQAVLSEQGDLYRIEPLKWWWTGSALPKMPEELGMGLDLSHSRTVLDLSGPQTMEILARHFPLDFRPQSFMVNAVASSFFHHSGVILCHRGSIVRLYLPRGFALSLVELLLASGKQFGIRLQSA